MLYRSLCSQALQWSWRNRRLWIFGLFVSFLGNGGAVEFMARSFSILDSATTTPSVVSPLALLFQSERGLRGFTEVFRMHFSDLLSPLIVIAIGLIILLLLVWCASVSLGSIIAAASRAAKNPSPSFEETLHEGYRSWKGIAWMLVAASVAMSVSVFIAQMIVHQFAQAVSTRSTAIAVIVALVLLVVLVYLFFLALYGIFYIVLKQTDWKDALRKAHGLITSTWIMSIEATVVFFLTSSVIGLIATVISVIFGWPFILASLLLYYPVGSPIGMWLSLLIGVVLMVGLVVVAGSYIAFYQMSAWTFFFQEISSPRKSPVGFMKWCSQWFLSRSDRQASE